MKSKIYANLLLAILLVLTLAACNNSKEPAKQTGDSDHHESHNHAVKENEKANPAQTEKDFQYELDGLSKLETDVKKDDFESAGNLFEQLHEVYHPSVLPSVEKKNPDLAEEMHNKFDALEDAINKKDMTQALNMVNTNRQYFLKAAKELGLSLK
jgi:uncharacterized lipoprotein YehR (DUF1307 family)